MATRQYVHNDTIGDAARVPVAATLSVIDLLLRADDGDPTAWEEIIRRYSKLCLLYTSTSPRD